MTTKDLLRKAHLWGKVAYWTAIAALLLAAVAVVLSLVNGPQVTVTFR